MSFFRSEPMSLCQIVLHTESAFNCLIELGYVGKVQFRNIYDGSTVANNLYATEIKRCHELKRIISYLQQEIEDLNIKIVIYPDVDEDEIPEADDLKTMETTVQQYYEELTQVAGNVDVFKRQSRQLYERLEVLEKADIFLGAQGVRPEAIMAWSDSVIRLLLQNELNAEDGNEGVHLSFFTGTIAVERFQPFETMLWRVTRGYFFIKHEEMKPLDKENFTRKYVFMVFFLGSELRKKIAKICQGFGIQLFECSESLQERRLEAEHIKQEMQDLEAIIKRIKTHCFNLLLLASADIYIWRVKVDKMLKVYYVLNRMSRIRHLHLDKYLQAECWIPTHDVESVRVALLQGARRTAKDNSRSMFIPLLNELQKRNLMDLDKPTYFVLNKFTQGFQNLIDSYGIAQYQELNPAPYTIITFPFLFAVMFGDIGHGVIMFLFGLWMVLKEQKLEEQNRFAAQQSEIWNILFAGRYIILLMGAFSIYTGFIYNDCFSKSFNIFGSSWRADLNKTTVLHAHYIQLDPYDQQQYLGTPYVFGMDPVWDASGENAIITFNSLKMKLAIILGVAQMCFGLILSAFNHIHKKDYVDLLLVFLPQLTFLLSIFAYLVFLIFFKWLQFGGHTKTPYNSACAPSILIVFINMLLMKGPEEPPVGCEIWMFDLQPYLQIVLLTLALICIPLLLAGRPVYFMIQEKNLQKIKNEALRKTRTLSTLTNMRKSLVYNVESSLHPVKSEIAKKEAAESKTDLSELWIHSGIHCIESILGSVSHTASYLRLWALSLAHDQLSTVLWNMVLKIGLTGQRGYWNSLVLYMVFIFWSILTVAILVVMEGLSAFLHTLRLHWVEFQSKFYAGSGEVFQPFRFEKSSPHYED
ncbi:V-type proton ATPase 116 kDa subunit a-like [Lucilia sericata]|uniref:V-type proton ATPase 116 kDa subunit a-like n=1 Tax=Lucilia sericata TaxID=13632 RepID=UPI0018A81F08|nr:V-type proton ATPase 116 kDa subunit a-like [Lucilia sericata]